MSVFDGMARDAGYRGDEAREVAARLEQEQMEEARLEDELRAAFEARVDAAIAEANERIASCHERLRCPTCHAPVGERCRRARAQHVRRGVFGPGQPVLKHPHRARWTQEVPER